VIWYDFLKSKKAACVDKTPNYSFVGNLGTKKNNLMVIDIDKCMDSPLQDFKCANESELDKFLATHSFTLVT